jgi:hypothetical protein
VIFLGLPAAEDRPQAAGTVWQLRRYPDFAEKMAEVLRVYHRMKVLKSAAASKKEPKAVALIPVTRSRYSPPAGPCPGQGSPSPPRVPRISSSFSMLPIRITRHRADPRQSFCAHLQRDKGLTPDQPARRFEFIFTPTHGSWLNLVEGFFSKLASSLLSHNGPPALQKRLGQGQTYSPDRGRLSIQP